MCGLPCLSVHAALVKVVGLYESLGMKPKPCPLTLCVECVVVHMHEMDALCRDERRHADTVNKSPLDTVKGPAVKF